MNNKKSSHFLAVLTKKVKKSKKSLELLKKTRLFAVTKSCFYLKSLNTLKNGSIRLKIYLKRK